ncbi:MAG: hypothetical protein CVV64_09670 [Candidatus Wallbacteria bacterium HGW-Wallbacteria-1]|jgi:hypothetical protein|uniref:Nucleotidyltransferase family protein n=1 Tax=Candidatus Wallbacteria bacterium HGW-Wallbacteria-1 TaxID=2013854 RepID=A0A2N1PQJ2_9BACT|nr:MAG: hypothetical protein CVV64_09670 [Candidatus Wallbacteria bacterium HGW-Wallbacteria-1]
MSQIALLPTVSQIPPPQSRVDLRLSGIIPLLSWSLQKNYGPAGFIAAINGGLAPLMVRYSSIPRIFRQQFSDEATTWTAKTIFLERELTEVLTILSDFCEPVLLKGIDLVPVVYGNDFTLRPMDDLDIFVEPDCFAESLRVLQTQGFKVRTPFNGSHTTLVRDDFFFGVELHCRLSRDSTSPLQRIVSRCLKVQRPYPSKPCGKGLRPLCWHLNPEIRVRYLIFHFWKHGFVIGKWLADLILLMIDPLHADIFKRISRSFRKTLLDFIISGKTSAPGLSLYPDFDDNSDLRSDLSGRVAGTTGFLMHLAN